MFNGHYTRDEPTAEELEIKRLRETHSLYKLYAPEWEQYLQFFEGGPEVTSQKNIFKHIRENDEDYKVRVDRAHYINYCEPLVSFFTNFIFSETIDRNGGDMADWYNEFILDVNRRGDNVDDFMRQVSDDTQIFGMSYVLVDAPQLPEGIDASSISVADEQEMKMRPYWVLVKPTEVTDWIVDQFDEFDYLKQAQCIDKVVNLSIRKVERYTEWYEDQIVVSEIDITDPAKAELLPKQTFPNTLGEIPVRVGRYKRSKRYPHMGNSFLRDFAKNNREIMNLTSLLQEFLYKQCFNVLAMETDSNLPLTEQEVGSVGSSNALTFPKGSTPPQYVSPPVDPAEFLQSERASIVNEMYKRAAQDTLNELFNGGKSSGFSQAQSFSKTVPFISNRADTLERIETSLMNLTTARVSGKWTGKIKYKDRYELTNLTDAITQLQMLARDLMIPSETFVKEELKRLVHEYDGKLTPDIIAQVEKQIEDCDFKKWQETQKEALVGQNKPLGNSPGSQQKPKSSGSMAEVAKEAKSSNIAATKKTKK